MPSESFEQRLRAYLDQRTLNAGGPGAIDRVMATAFDGRARHPSRRLFAAIAVAVAVALVVATPITVLLLRQSPRGTLAPATGVSPSAHATPTPSAPVTSTGPPHVNLVPVGVAFWDTQRGLLVATPACDSSAGVCPGGLIERTGNGGKTWLVVDRVSASLTAVASAGSDVAWVSEAGGSSCGAGAGSCLASTLLLTTDGGTHWTVVSSLTPVASVSPVSRTTAWAVAGLPGSLGLGTIPVRSSDGGRTWQPRAALCSPGIGVTPWAVSFASAVDGWLMCTGVAATDMQSKELWSTHDDGATWQLESQTCLSSANGQAVRDVGSLSCVGDYPTLSLLSDGHGWMYAERGGLSATSDGGQKWTQIGANVVTNDVNAVISASLVGDMNGFVLITHSESDPVCPTLGCGPELLSTQDGGRTWTIVDSWVA